MQLPNISEEIKRIQTLYDSCKEQLLQLPGIVINSPEQGLPYVLNFSTCSVRSETMLHFWHPNISLFPAVLRVLRESAVMC